MSSRLPASSGAVLSGPSVASRFFALLDDGNASPLDRSSRLFMDFVHEHRCTDPTELDACWHAARADVACGLHLVAVADYEWGARLQGVETRWQQSESAGSLRLLAFRTMQCLSSDETVEWLNSAGGGDAPEPAGVFGLTSTVSPQDYEDAIERVLEYIRCGDTYQINYTYRLRGTAFGEPLALYRRLRARQPVPFGALMKLPRTEPNDPSWVLSRSPELFIRHKHGHLVAKPMKGTAPRHTEAHQDEVVREWLANDPKNRAENLMIVDLLRNDLGRVARIGTVRVPALFTVETYPTLHQMTSTVEADVRDGLDFPDILRALYPCGSITGAPKIHTMELIDELETTPRRIYTGVIGWLASPGDNVNCIDFCLSVAIRTLLLGPAKDDGLRDAELGVGGGIVIDSRPDDELHETRVKARFLTTLDPGFRLFETMRLCRGRGILRLESHLARLARSARELGFSFDRHRVIAELQRQLDNLPHGEVFRLRLDLSFDGTPVAMATPFISDAAAPGTLLLYVLADAPLPREESALVRHKTTIRETYDNAVRSAEAIGAHDTLFFNSSDMLTEGARTNVFVKLDGHWCTPPLECGLLPGVIRGRLLHRPSWAYERRISRSDLARAESVVLCSSLRGLHAAAHLKC